MSTLYYLAAEKGVAICCRYITTFSAFGIILKFVNKKFELCLKYMI